MIEYVAGNILDGQTCGIFCWRTNCFGRIGRELAGRYPEVKNMDRRLYRMLGSDELFGTIRAVKCDDGRICVNAYAQYGCGGSNTDGVDEAALHRCLDSLATFLNENVAEGVVVGFPHWFADAETLERFAERVPQRVVVVKKRGRQY